MEMNRRTFMESTMASGLCLAAIATLFQSTAAHANGSSPVDAGEFTDNDNDYVSWPTRNKGLSRAKVLLIEKGLDLNGQPLKGKCLLYRFQAGFKVPRHFHPKGEFTYVLAGSFTQAVKKNGSLSLVQYKKGDVVWMPPQTVHEEAMALEKGVTILSFTPEDVMFSGFPQPQ